MLRCLSSAAVALVSGLPSSAAAQGQAPEGYEATYEQYKRYLTTTPLVLHTIGRTRLAATKDPRALEILIDDFGQPESPKQVVRHLLAGIVTRSFTDDASVDSLAEWREDYTKPVDSWLWFRTLSVDARNRGPEACLATIRDKQAGVHLKAAALEALGWCEDPAGLYTGIEEVMRALPKKPYEKAVLVGGMASALERHRRKVTTSEYKSACSYFIHLLDDEHGLGTDTKLVIARHLGRILDSDELVINAEPWVARLADKGRRIPKKDGPEYVRPTFFGVEATGSRICYVIDMSDSMCKQVQIPEERKTGPVSGPKEKKAKGELPTEDDIPWHLVETRFDLAREQLKLSLLRLDEDTSFAVVFFGDEAGLLESCKGMARATSGYVKKVIKELDAIEQDTPTDNRPDGRLRGQTNLHGGLRQAFRVKKKGLLEEGSYVDLDAFAEGADTIFLLSDGRPSWDDYPDWDSDYGEFAIGDPESGKKGGGGNRMHYSGPYRDETNLLEDVERLNLFREVEIHCIGVGRESPRALLERIAEIGHGRLYELSD